MRISRLLAAALLLVALLAAGAAAQEAVVEGVGPEEIAAKAKAKEEAVLGQLRAKISALGACVHTWFRSIRVGLGMWFVSDAASFGFAGSDGFS